MLMAQLSTYDKFESCHMLTAEPLTYDNFLFLFLENNRKTCHMLTAQQSTYDMFGLIELYGRECSVTEGTLRLLRRLGEEWINRKIGVLS